MSNERIGLKEARRATQLVDMIFLGCTDDDIEYGNDWLEEVARINLSWNCGALDNEGKRVALDRLESIWAEIQRHAISAGANSPPTNE